MSEDYAGGDPDLSEMHDDELYEVVNSSYGRYRPELVDGAKKELGRRAARAQNEAPPLEGDGPPVWRDRQCETGEAHPPAPPAGVPGGKLFSVGQMTFATFLTGPLAAFLLMAHNYRALGEGRSAWRSLAIGVIATALLILLGFLLPGGAAGGRGMGIGVGLATYFHVKNSQGAAIHNHLRAGGRRGSWPATIAAMLGSLVIVVLAAAVVYSFQDTPVAKVRVSQTGQVELNGANVTREQFRAALASLGDEGGEVWYYREAPREPPSEEALKSFKLILEAELPVRVSSKPDFSDYIDADGNSVPIQ